MVGKTGARRRFQSMGCRVMVGLAAACGALGAAAGCGGDARVELAAADAIEAVAAQMRLTLDEYHEQVVAYDDAREAEAIAAFVARLRADLADQRKTTEHMAAFREAMARLRLDRRAEWQRYTAAGDNVALLDELTQDLRKLAIESLTLRDELRRYLTDVLAARRQSRLEQNRGGSRVAGPNGACRMEPAR